MMRAWFQRLAVSVGIVCLANEGHAIEIPLQPELIGTVKISGHTTDLSGLDSSLETQTPANAFGGLSAIEYSGHGNEYLVLSDRGPADGAATFPCRFHRLTIDLTKSDAPDPKLQYKLLSTHLFHTKDGAQLTGSLSKLRAWNGIGACPSLDPEGLRSLDQNLLVSDEYGPSIQVFSANGNYISSFSLPKKFGLAELRDSALEQGAYSNRGLEGICVTPDRSSIISVLQGPLVQDGHVVNHKCLGTHTRWIRVNVATHACQEFIYDLDDESTGVSEILAVDNERFLVLERDSLSGDAAKIKRIYLASINHASEVSNVDSLKDGLPDGVKAIRKDLFLDLMLPEYGLCGAATPEKPEGLAWGPPLADGRRLLLVCFDNDFDPNKETILAAFAVSLR